MKQDDKSKKKQLTHCQMGRLCEVSLAQPRQRKDPDWYPETYNYHFEDMKQMNDIRNKLKEEGMI